MSVQAWSTHTTDDEVAEYLKDQIKGKVVLVTGVTQGGIGADFARAIIKHNPALIILAGRQHAKGVETQEILKAENPAVETRVLDLDLGDQSSVRKAAEEVNSYKENIDVLVNNAAVMACPWALTVDGIESQFGIGHIGHFLFTNLIMGKILAAGQGARIINVSSRGHRLGGVKFDDYNFNEGKDYERWRAYGQVKTANILFSIALADRLGPKGVLSFSLHPGGIHTNLGRHMTEDDFERLAKTVTDMKSIPAGGSTTTVAAFDPSIVHQNGAYLQDCHLSNVVEGAKEWATGIDNANKLWELSEKIVGQKFEY